MGRLFVQGQDCSVKVGVILVYLSDRHPRVKRLVAFVDFAQIISRLVKPYEGYVCRGY